MKSIIQTEKEDWLSLVEEMFGIPLEVFDGLCVVALNSKTVSVVPQSLVGLPRDLLLSAGITLFHTRIKIPKLSTAAVVAFGKYSTRMTVELSQQAITTYCQRHSQILDPKTHFIDCYRDGYVIVSYRFHEQRIPIGLGMLRTLPDQRRTLESYYPKACRLLPNNDIFSSVS